MELKYVVPNVEKTFGNLEFAQNHENNPAAWRVIGYDGSGVASSQGDMTLLAAGNMGAPTKASPQA